MTQLDIVPGRPGIAGKDLTPEQVRFNTLIAQIEQARKLIADWHQQINLFRKAYVDTELPLIQELKATQRKWVIALDAVADHKRWTRSERETLVQMIFAALDNLLEGDEDPELKAIYNRHAELDYATDRALEIAAMKGMAEAMTGMDLGKDEDITSEAELFRRVQEQMAAQAEAHRAAAEAHATQARAKKKTTAQKKREAETEEATLSVREIFRKLASALHPDREPDPAERLAKTALMQEANQAYAANDLLALLELQLKIEQIDADHLVGVDAKRLKHYNKVLTEQLSQLRHESTVIGHRFTSEFDLDPAWKPNPRRLGNALAERTRNLRGTVAALQQEMSLFDNVSWMKKWLKRQRVLLEEDDTFAMDDFF